MVNPKKGYQLCSTRVILQLENEGMPRSPFLRFWVSAQLLCAEDMHVYTFSSEELGKNLASGRWELARGDYKDLTLNANNICIYI